jgi:hypothetical protein
MTGPEYDAELEAFLKRRSMMHRRLSDIDHAEPSVELDRLVLNRARAAIETPAQPLYRTSRWALPVGLAATILIAFTVVLNLDHHGAKLASNTPAVAPQTPAPAAARAASVRETERIEQQRVVSDSAASEPREAPAERKSAAPGALANRTRGAAGQSTAVPNADASNSPPLVVSAGAAVSTGVPAAPSPALVAAPPPRAAADDPHSTPDAWLREINRLRAAGKTAEADREVTAFREAYPSHPAYSVAKPPTR